MDSLHPRKIRVSNIGLSARSVEEFRPDGCKNAGFVTRSGRLWTQTLPIFRALIPRSSIANALSAKTMLSSFSTLQAPQSDCGVHEWVEKVLRGARRSGLRYFQPLMPNGLLYRATSIHKPDHPLLPLETSSMPIRTRPNLPPTVSQYVTQSYYYSAAHGG